MKIQLIRNATMKLEYAGKIILTDPMLSKRGTIRSFAGKEKNPIIDLPVDMNKILEDIDSVLVSHMHPDHFDDVAGELIDKDIPVFIQENEKEKIEAYGFRNVSEIKENIEWNGIKISKIGGLHGSGAILERMGKVSGYILQAKNEPTVYWIGDSIWCNEVEDAINKFNPDIIITHSGGAVIPGFNKILMDEKETIKVAEKSKKVKIVAVHMEAVDHCIVTRELLKVSREKAGISSKRLLIPADGEIIEFKN